MAGDRSRRLAPEPARRPPGNNPGGCRRCGDIGIMGKRRRVRSVDRKKDMTLMSGFNMDPNKTEQMVNRHPGVRACAAVGMADPHPDQAVRRFVTRADLTTTFVGRVLRRALRPHGGGVAGA